MIKQFLGLDIALPGGLIDVTGESSVAAGDASTSESRPEYQHWEAEFELVDALGASNLEGKVRFHQGRHGLGIPFELPFPMPSGHAFLGDESATATTQQRLGGRIAVDHPSGAGEKYSVLADEVRVRNTSTGTLALKTGRPLRFANYPKWYTIGDDVDLAAGAMTVLRIYPTLRADLPHGTVGYLEPTFRCKWVRTSSFGYARIEEGGENRLACRVREALR